jgi:predicted metalloendopeptidase
MADEVSIPDNLKQRFSQFDAIAEVTERLQGKIVKINAANKEAAGEDDATAKAYHKQVDKATDNLSQLVGDIATLFGVTSTRGTNAASSLEGGADEAGAEARTWENPDVEK